MSDTKKTIVSMQTEERVFAPHKHQSEHTFIGSLEASRAEYERSIKAPDAFWAGKAEEPHWYKKWDTVCESELKTPMVKWFKGGKLNVSYNCVDRHAHGPRRNKAALIWECEVNRFFATWR